MPRSVVESQSVVTILQVEVVFLAAALAVFFGRALVSAWTEARYAPRVERARAAIARGLVGTDRAASWPATLAALRALPLNLRRPVLLEVGRSIQGEALDSVRALAFASGVQQQAESNCSSRLWWRRLSGVRTLTVLGVQPEPLLLIRLMNDPDRTVQAQAIEWAVDHPTPEVVRGLLDRLAAGGPIAKFHIPDALWRMGGHVPGPLAEFLQASVDSPAVLEPALRVASGVPDPAYARCAVLLAVHEQPQVRALALELLGALGAHDQIGLIQQSLHDPVEPVRTAAARTVGTLRSWQAGLHLAEALRDPSWAVRREAAASLLALGAPGVLYLRRAITTETDPFAVDMARQALDVWEAAALPTVRAG